MKNARGKKMERENLREAGRLIPLTKWPKFHPWPSVAGLRHLRFYEASNGFAGVFVKVGKRVLVDEDAFFRAARGADKE